MMSVLMHGDGRMVQASDPIRIRISDPIDGGSILREDSRDVLFEWCLDNCKDGYWIGMGFGLFESEDDALLFRLRWGQ
jgi:hypothetical protein